MTKDNEQNITSLEQQRLIKSAANLKSVYQPERDLWPEIEARINASPVQSEKPLRQWMPYALAASVLMTVASMGFATKLYVNQMQTLSPVLASIDHISAIEQPYTLARASYLEEMVVQDDELSTEIRLVLKENLEIIDNAIKDIRLALEHDPNDKFLINKLIQTREQEMALFRQLTKRRVSTI